MSTPNTYVRVAAVTGSNKGIGLACVRQLALQYPQSTLSNNGTSPFLIYLTARNQERGEEALRTIQNDPQLQSAKALHSQGGLTTIKYLPLDIDSRSSIEGFADHLKKEHPEGLDILINNAGIALDGFNAQQVKQTLACNYYGTLDACTQLLPHMRRAASSSGTAGGVGGSGSSSSSSSRIVNVASMSGVLNHTENAQGVKTRGYSTTIQNRFLDAKSMDQVTSLMEEFAAAVEKGDWEKDWPTSAYMVSKAGVIAASKVLAVQAQQDGNGVLVNACCPGYVNTDMTKGKGHKHVDEGARTPVMLALADLNGQKGEFWKDERIVSWVNNQVE